MKPLSERDENLPGAQFLFLNSYDVGMKPLSERDENHYYFLLAFFFPSTGRNEATL